MLAQIKPFALFLCIFVLYLVICRLSLEGFDSEVCTFNEDDDSVMTRSAIVDVNGQCHAKIEETGSSRENDLRCRAAMKSIGFPEKSSMRGCGYCVLDDGILQDTDDGSRCEILPTNTSFFRNVFNCSDKNNKLFDSIKGKAGAVLSGIGEDKNTGRCVLTFKDSVSEQDMRGYMEFLSTNAECGGCTY